MLWTIESALQYILTTEALSRDFDRCPDPTGGGHSSVSKVVGVNDAPTFLCCRGSAKAQRLDGRVIQSERSSVQWAIRSVSPWVAHGWTHKVLGPLVTPSVIYCLLASPLMVSPEPEVLLRIKYPLPWPTIIDTCVLLMGSPQLSVTVQSELTE